MQGRIQLEISNRDFQLCGSQPAKDGTMHNSQLFHLLLSVTLSGGPKDP